MTGKFNFLILPVVVLNILNWACAQSGDQKDSGNEEGSQEASSGSQTAQSELTSIPVEAMRDLWANCDALDIIFYETNFSLSQSDRGAIQSILNYFLPAAITHDPSCKPMGRITFLVQGEIRQEADIYMSQNCNYFIWMNDNSRLHINPMSPQGATFFQGIIKQAQGMQ